MNKYINDLKKKYSEDLCKSSLEFFENGIDLFYKYLNSECSCMHIALSSLCTGLELALKAFIAEKNLGVIFKDLPADLRVLLTCPTVSLIFTNGENPIPISDLINMKR